MIAISDRDGLCHHGFFLEFYCLFNIASYREIATVAKDPVSTLAIPALEKHIINATNGQGPN